MRTVVVWPRVAVIVSFAADLQAMELATANYPAEVARYKEETPPLVFKQYLIASRGCPR